MSRQRLMNDTCDGRTAAAANFNHALSPSPLFSVGMFEWYWSRESPKAMQHLHLYSERTQNTVDIARHRKLEFCAGVLQHSGIILDQHIL